MDWNNAYLIPLYNALLIPVLIFGLGLVVEGFGNLLTAVISLFFGGSVAFFVRNRLTFIGTVHHELAHALFATLSGAKVTKNQTGRIAAAAGRYDRNFNSGTLWLGNII